MVEINELPIANIWIEYKTEYFTADLPIILSTPRRDLDQKIKTVQHFNFLFYTKSLIQWYK